MSNGYLSNGACARQLRAILTQLLKAFTEAANVMESGSAFHPWTCLSSWSWVLGLDARAGNWVRKFASIYWPRETDENFQKRCNKCSDGTLSHNSREATLFRFASLYSKTWKLTWVKIVPHFIPNFSYIPTRSGMSSVTFSSSEPSCWHATTLLDIGVLAKEEFEQAPSDLCTYSSLLSRCCPPRVGREPTG